MFCHTNITVILELHTRANIEWLKSSWRLIMLQLGSNLSQKQLYTLKLYKCIDWLIFKWLPEKINDRLNNLCPLHSLNAIIVTLFNLDKLLTIEWTLKSHSVHNKKNLNLIRLSKPAFFLTRVKRHSAPGRWNKK